MRRFTASNSVQLANGCNAWLADNARWVDTPRKGTALGVQKHGLLQSAVDGSDAGDVDEKALVSAEAFGPALEEMMALGEAHAEVAFCMMPDGSEASVLGEGKGREVYALAPPGVMTGTADIVVLPASTTSSTSTQPPNNSKTSSITAHH